MIHSLGNDCFQRELYVTANDAALGVAHKEDDFIALFGGGKLGFNALNGIGVVEAGEVEVAVDFLNVANYLGGEATAAKADRVDTGIGNGLASCLDIWRNVLVDKRTALNHDMRADVTELVDESASANHGKVVNDNLTGNLSGIGDNHIVANHTVVSYVAVGHNEAVAADNGLALGGGATVDGNTFANGGVVADYGKSVLATELEVLRDAGDNGTGENGAILANTSALHYGDIGADASALADLHILLNGDEGVNNHTGSNLGSGMYVC